MIGVQLENITKNLVSADHHFSIQKLSLEIEGGRIISLLGPSGCGKTTVLKLIAGLAYPDSGRILLGGRDITKVVPNMRETVMVFQHNMLFPFMSVERNVAFGLTMQRRPRAEIEERVQEILQFVQLEGMGRRKPSELSGGQCQRVALARALVIQPKVLLLDEPLSSLDAHLRYEMRKIILRLKQKHNLTIVFVTHDQEEAILLGDKIALMFDGAIEQYGDSKAFFEHPKSLAVALFFGNRNFIEGIKRNNVIETECGCLSLGKNVSSAQFIEDGPIWLLARPEILEICADTRSSLSATVLDTRYMGTHITIRLKVGHREWNMIRPVGDISLQRKIQLAIPAQQIILLKRDETNKAPETILENI